MTTPAGPDRPVRMKVSPYPVEPRTLGAKTAEPGRDQRLDQDRECRPLLAFRAAVQQHHGRQRPCGAVRPVQQTVQLQAVRRAVGQRVCGTVQSGRCGRLGHPAARAIRRGGPPDCLARRRCRIGQVDVVQAAGRNGFGQFQDRRPAVGRAPTSPASPAGPDVDACSRSPAGQVLDLDGADRHRHSRPAWPCWPPARMAYDSRSASSRRPASAAGPGVPCSSSGTIRARYRSRPATVRR